MITNMSHLNIVDGATTPVVHVFSPASRVAENTARWVDREHNNGVAIGFSSITLTVKEPTVAGGVYRQRLTLSVPKVDFTIPTAPVLLGVTRANVELIFPDILNHQERTDITAMLRDILGRGATDKLGDNIVYQSLPY